MAVARSGGDRCVPHGRRGVAASLAELPGLSGRIPTLADGLSAFVAQGRTIPAVGYALCGRLRAGLAREVDDLAVDVDFLVLPAVQSAAPPVDKLTAAVAGGEMPWFDVAQRNTMPFNVLGWPALTVPIGRGDEGMPLWMQIVAKPGRDDALPGTREPLSGGHRSPSRLAVLPVGARQPA